MSHDRELEIALSAAGAAGQALVRLYAAFEVVADAPADITTDADRQSQEIILHSLKAAFPGDALCAEEETSALAGAASIGERLWIVDPIDGTRGFARKNGEFSVMIAFVEHGQIGVGVVLEPVKGRLTYAARGRGCWRRDDGEDRRCHVSTQSQLEAATLTQSRSRQGGNVTPAVAALKPQRIVETYSAGIKLALVARGEADVYVNDYRAFHDWDICAGHILVEEAGGKVTGMRGEVLHYGLPGAWQRHGVLASNGLMHEAAARLLAGPQ